MIMTNSFVDLHYNKKHTLILNKQNIIIMDYVARQSEHIQEDIKRNWSSWNFGNDGLECTEKELEDYKNECIENDKGFHISGFELWNDDISQADIRQLYKGYWVLVDNINASGGLSCIELDSENLESAIVESQSGSFFGDGDVFDTANAKLVYSSPCNEIHIFEYEG